MAQVSLDMYQTLAIAVVALLIGAWLKTKIKVLDRLCIPSSSRRPALLDHHVRALRRQYSRLQMGRHP